MVPGAGVVSREISQDLGGRLVVEASQSGLIVVGDEGDEVGVSFGVVAEAAMVGGAVLRHPVEVFADAAVEAPGHAVGSRVEGLGEAVGDAALAAEGVEGVVSGGLVVGFAGLVDSDAVGELGSVVGKDGVGRHAEAAQKALEEGGGGLAAAIGQDFEVDEAGGAIDCDVGVAAPAASGSRYLTSIWMNPAGLSVWKARTGASRGCGGPRCRGA